MPSRLIEISNTGEIWNCQLRANINGLVRYTALSYCWGSQEFIKTTSDSISRWMIGIPWIQLPKSIQDAIIVTYQLGLRFLWVDALCIVQDDEDDKAIEISAMAQIYGQAEVTIVAACANHVEEGFLDLRVTSESAIFQLPFRCLDGDIGSVELVQAPRQYEDEPIDTRGWAMQERLLARRVLEFGTRQTRYTSKENSDGHYDGWTPHAEFANGRHDKLPSEIILPGGVGLERPPFHSLIGNWHDLLFHYTHRQLTVESDRILAIAGIAKRYSAIIPGQYLAGLWRAALPQDLLWRIEVPIRKRPTFFQAPSWSWASVNGTVYSGDYGTDRGMRLPGDLHIVDIELNLRIASDTFGAVKSGSLRVRGRLRVAEWKQECFRGRNTYCDKLRLPSSSGPGGFLALRASSDAEEIDGFGADWSVIYLLLVLVSRPPEPPRYDWERPKPVYSGLLLRNQGMDVYTRLGVFSFVPDYDYHESIHTESEEQWRARFLFRLLGLTTVKRGQSHWYSNVLGLSITIFLPLMQLLGTSPPSQFNRCKGKSRDII
jgi:hypothetical protein